MDFTQNSLRIDEHFNSQPTRNDDNSILNINLSQDENGTQENDVTLDEGLDLELEKIESIDNKGNTKLSFKESSIVTMKCCHLAMTKMATLQDSSNIVLNSQLLVQKMKQEFGNDDQTFVKTGNSLGYLLSKVPEFTYLKPCMPLHMNPNFKAKKERVRRQQRDKEGVVQVIAGKSTQQVHEETAEDSSISKELDKIRKQLKAAWRNSTVKDSIGYYEFVLNPEDFSKSVENMFYVSFLIKDGTVHVDVDPRTGLPSLKKLRRDERENLNVDRSRLETSQVISRINYSTWQALVKKLGISNALITAD